jgi:hypothetical protein
MRLMMRRRSFLGANSISFAADGLMRSLNLATFPQILEDILECQIRFVGPFLEGSQVLCVLGQAQFDGVVDKIGDGSVRLGRLEAKAPVDL